MADRRIDGKFIIRDGQIIKESNGQAIPEDEPTFLLRARDRLALPLLLHYREISAADGCNDYHFGLLDKEIEAFRKFQDEHPERMKQPSITRGA